MKRKSLFSLFLLAGLMLVGFSTYTVYGQNQVKKVTTVKIVKYSCPMHPEVVMDKPGVCPKCGMKLVAKKMKIVENEAKTAPIPDDVNAVLKNSCTACHGTGGGAMALSALDLSKWDQYKPEKQTVKAAAICKTVTSGMMPPKPYLKAHPEATLTADQIALICKWSKTLETTK